VMAMGAVGDQITKLMSQVVDFGDLEDLKVTFPEDSSVFEDASDAASEDIGDVQVKDMFGIFASYDTKQESLLSNDAAWGGCLFSLAFAAGITNKKVRKVLKDGVRPSDLEFDIPQVVIPKLSKLTLAQRLARIECDMGLDDNRGSILVRVNNLENYLCDDDFDAGPSNVLSRVTALEKKLYNEDASKPQEIDEMIMQSQEEENNEGTKKTQDEILEENVIKEILQASLKSKDTRVKKYSADSVEEMALATAIKESNDIEAKRKMIDSLAANEAGGEIIPNNHEEDFELDDMALANLIEMGFEFGPACIILKKCNNDHNEALMLLLSDGDVLS